MSSDPQIVSRRGFAKAAAAAALVPVMAPLAACAGGQPEPASTPSAEPAATTGATPAAPSAPPQAQGARPRDPMAEELMEVLRVRFPDRLNAEQWEEVRRGIEGNQRIAKALHDFRIPTATEPATVFRAYRGGGR